MVTRGPYRVGTPFDRLLAIHFPSGKYRPYRYLIATIDWSGCGNYQGPTGAYTVYTLTPRTGIQLNDHTQFTALPSGIEAAPISVNPNPTGGLSKFINYRETQSKHPRQVEVRNIANGNVFPALRAGRDWWEFVGEPIDPADTDYHKNQFFLDMRPFEEEQKRIAQAAEPNETDPEELTYSTLGPITVGYRAVSTYSDYDPATYTPPRPVVESGETFGNATVTIKEYVMGDQTSLEADAHLINVVNPLQETTVFTHTFPSPRSRGNTCDIQGRGEGNCNPTANPTYGHIEYCRYFGDFHDEGELWDFSYTLPTPYPMQPVSDP